MLFTWSNFISFTRIFIALPIIYLHYTGGQQVDLTITLLVVYGIISDYLDGWMARRTGNITELGKAIDPIADKIAAFLLFLYAVHIGLIPLWFFAAAVVRDLLIICGSLYIQWTRGKIAMSVLSGKISVNALALYWIACFFTPEATGVQQFLMGNSIALMVVSFFDYFHRFNEIRTGTDFN